MLVQSLPLLVSLAMAGALGAQDTNRSPEDRALRYLTVEVPRWQKENHCFSCHNNGDAARALYQAIRLGRTIPGYAVADTTKWLRTPDNYNIVDIDDVRYAKELMRRKKVHNEKSDH